MKNERLEVSAYLWSEPDFKHWQRLSLFWFYLPVLIWRFLIGKPVLLAEKRTTNRGQKKMYETISQIFLIIIVFLLGFIIGRIVELMKQIKEDLDTLNKLLKRSHKRGQKKMRFKIYACEKVRSHKDKKVHTLYESKDFKCAVVGCRCYNCGHKNK